MAALVIALIGAESTGKSTLARELTVSLEADGLVVAHLDEYLRTFCDLHGRTPRQDEQVHIAAEQTRRIAAARDARLLPVDVVVADTTALMTAVYSDYVFGDTTLYPQALADHRQADLTLLMALDLPWIADGLQRDGPQVQQPVDQMLRRALLGAGVGFSVIGGVGPQRLANARAAWAAVQRQAAAGTPHRPTGGWRHHCGRCGDPFCEQHLFSR
ncbi:AAA family ATPase [Sphaerotilus sp.]|uniref:AAA family ATPase n=1 Tax=Sphaerotilus sp. TaxID=2093942 RepID=UPI002ACEC621|nr:AAA family ATPase [Sphaerotilus sp.]MDZ7856561.1 AAA family ATPase [Sphaerotilus sp.]